MGGLARDAAKLERHIRRRGFPATVDMYNGMIEAYSKAALYEEALSVLDGMTESKVEPDEVRVKHCLVSRLIGCCVDKCEPPRRCCGESSQFLKVLFSLRVTLLRCLTQSFEVP